MARKPRAPVAGDKAAPDDGPPPTGDIALVCGKDQHGTHILRRRSEQAPLELGLLRPLREGKPIEGEVISLTPRPEAPVLFDVKSELPDPRARPTEDGPPQVATDAYRKGWDAVWGRRRRDQTVN